jgi:flagellar protein FliS
MPPLLLPRDASARYQEIALASRLLGVDGHGLVEILYEELVQALDVLDARLRRGSVSLHEASATRARSILAALLTSLDPAQGQATELFAQVYRGMIASLHRAVLEDDMMRLREVRESAVEMQRTWRLLKLAH